MLIEIPDELAREALEIRDLPSTAMRTMRKLQLAIVERLPSTETALATWKLDNREDIFKVKRAAASFAKMAINMLVYAEERANRNQNESHQSFTVERLNISFIWDIDRWMFEVDSGLLANQTEGLEQTDATYIDPIELDMIRNQFDELATHYIDDVAKLIDPAGHKSDISIALDRSKLLWHMPEHNSDPSWTWVFKDVVPEAYNLLSRLLEGTMERDNHTSGASRRAENQRMRG